MKRWAFAAVFLGAVSARADTIYLKNGEFIDGVVSMKTDSFVELQIGDIGKIELLMEEVHSIEKNARTGGHKVETEVEGKGNTEVIKAKKAREAKENKGKEKKARLPEKDESEGHEAKGSSDEEKPEDGENGDHEEEGPSDFESQIDPELKKRIEQLVADLQRQKVRNRVQAERHLEAIGPPAIPFLVPIARNSSDLTRVAVMRLFHSFGDQRVIEAAIEGLLDDNDYVREFASKSLKRITGEDFGYQPGASPRRREVAHKKWASWWEDEKKLLAEERKLAEKAR